MFMIYKKSAIICIIILLPNLTLTAQHFNFRNFFGNLFGCRPTIKVECDKNTIHLGDSVLIQWEAQNADSVVLINKALRLPLQGKMYVKPTKKKVYRFYAYHFNKENRDYSLVKVISPKILAFKGCDETTDESSATLSWKTQNAKKIEIPGLADTLPANGSIEISPDTTTTYTLKVMNKNEAFVTKSKTVKVTYVENCSKDATMILGDTLELHWKFKNSKYAKLGGGENKFNPIDTVEISPKTTKTYKLTVERNNGDSLIKDINVKVIKPKIKYFRGDEYIFLGKKSTLYWETIQADLVYISELGKYFPSPGSVSVAPKESTTYHLSIDNRGIKEEQEHTIHVFKRAYVKDFTHIKDVPPGMRIDFEIFATDVSNYPKSIELYVLAVDTAGSFVRGLAPPYASEKHSRMYFKNLVEKFKYGKPHLVRDFQVMEVRGHVSKPLDINLTLDYSGSMLGSIDRLEEACKFFIDHKNKNDRLSIVRFDDELVCETPLTADKKNIYDSISFNGLKDFGGSTALYAAADEGLFTLRNSRRNKQQILFTDGFENSSFYYWQSRAFTAQMLAKRAKMINTRINIAAFGPCLNKPLLKYLSMITGGNYYQIYSTKQIGKVFKEIPLLFRNYYVIKYTPRKDEGERVLRLIYNNNHNNEVMIKKRVFIGDDYNLMKFEYDKDHYTNKINVLWKGKSPISPPQVVAMFDFNMDNLKEKFYSNLDFYIKFLQKRKNSSAIILGHTDHVGSHAQCNDLSQRRASAIEKYLVEKGIDKSRLTLVPCGKKYPLWVKENEEWKARENRRVEILLVE